MHTASLFCKERLTYPLLFAARAARLDTSWPVKRLQLESMVSVVQSSGNSNNNIPVVWRGVGGRASLWKKQLAMPCHSTEECLFPFPGICQDAWKEIWTGAFHSMERERDNTVPSKPSLHGILQQVLFTATLQLLSSCMGECAICCGNPSWNSSVAEQESSSSVFSLHCLGKQRATKPSRQSQDVAQTS